MAAYRILVLFWMMIGKDWSDKIVFFHLSLDNHRKGLAWLGSLLSISSDRFGTLVGNYMDKVKENLLQYRHKPDLVAGDWWFIKYATAQSPGFDCVNTNRR